jgi:hypothetical protein
MPQTLRGARLLTGNVRERTQPAAQLALHTPPPGARLRKACCKAYLRCWPGDVRVDAHRPQGSRGYLRRLDLIQFRTCLLLELPLGRP